MTAANCAEIETVMLAVGQKDAWLRSVGGSAIGNSYREPNPGNKAWPEDALAVHSIGV